MPLIPPRHDPHVGDIGTAFRGIAKDLDPVTGAEIILDIATATITWRFRRPDGTTFDRPTSIVGPSADGRFEYVSVSGDLDKEGDWVREAFIVLPGSGSWWAEETHFHVTAPLAVPA